MFYSTCNPDSFNKTIHNAQGTLVQNWQEERVLREETGVGRTLPKGHINKKHDDLFRKPVEELTSVYQQSGQDDETFGRVFGRKHEPNFVSEHKEKYTKRTSVQEPAFGKKHELIEKQFLNMINEELVSTIKTDEDFQNQRFLNTTYGNEFAKKNVGVNVVGRRVMRDQNGKSLAPDTRDEDLLVEHGFLKRSPLADEQELQAAVKKEGYLRAQPYTFWAEKQQDGAYYSSKPTGEHAPFTRNNDFLKTYTHYTHKKN